MKPQTIDSTDGSPQQTESPSCLLSFGTLRFERTTDSMQSMTPPKEAWLLLASKVSSPRVKALLLDAAQQQTPAPPPAPHPDALWLRAAVEALPPSNLTKMRLIEQGILRPAPPRPALHGKIVTRTTAEEAVRQALRHEPLTARAIQEQTGLAKSSVHEALSQLAAGGAVHVVGKGTRTDPFLYSRKVDTDDSSDCSAGLPAESLRDSVAGRILPNSRTVTIPEE